MATKADIAQTAVAYGSDSPQTSGGHQVIIAPTNVLTQQAAGAPLNVSAGFTLAPRNHNVGYSLRIVLGVGGVATKFTILGTYSNIVNQRAVINANGAGTFETDIPFTTITALLSDVNPGGTVDLQSLDCYFAKNSRGVWVGGTGILSARLADDDFDTQWAGIPSGTMIAELELNRIRCSQAGRTGIDPTTATLITVGR